MRSVDVLLNDFEEIKILCQFLYANEENSVRFKNAIDIPLELTMTEDFIFKLKNLNFEGDIPSTVQYGLYELSVIVDLLKEEKPELFVGNMANHGITNRWEEIIVLTNSVISLNKVRNKKGE